MNIILRRSLCARRVLLPKEGKKVRQLVTECLLMKFVFPVDQRLLVVPGSRLLEQLDDAVSAIYERRLKR
jgi:hypothetical protein